MKFNVQRVLTPAYLTSIALVVIGVLLAMVWTPGAAWLFVLVGLGLNAMAVSVTEIHDSPRARSAVVRRRSVPASGVGDLDGDRGVRSDPGHAPAADAGSHAADGLRRTAEPSAETADTPVVPHTGSSTLKHPPGR